MMVLKVVSSFFERFVVSVVSTTLVITLIFLFLIDPKRPVIVENPDEMFYTPKNLETCEEYTVRRTFDKKRDCAGKGVVFWSCEIPNDNPDLITTRVFRPTTFVEQLSMGINRREATLESPCDLPVNSVCTQTFQFQHTCNLLPVISPMSPLIFNTIPAGTK